MYMLWFKFILGLKVFELVSILFAIVPDYGNDTLQKKIKIEPVLKIFTKTKFEPQHILSQRIWFCL